MTNAENDGLRKTQDAITAQPSPTSDAQLLRLMQTGDADAWQTLYKRYLPSAWRLAWQLVGDHQVAEDLVAESLLALCRRASELDPDSTKLFGWLRGVIRHKAMDHHRFKSRTSAALNQRAILQEDTDSQQQLNNRPSARLEQSEHVDDVLEVLEELDETKRQCLQWKYLERISVREIAARLDLTEKAVESILYRARLEFRERFEKLDNNSDAQANHSQSIEPSNRSSDQ